MGESRGDAGQVRVVVRLRPDATKNKRESPVVRLLDGCRVEVGNGERLEFAMDAAYGSETSQRQLFESECAPLVNGVIEGRNGIIMAYGQTGAGKSYSVIGKSKRAWSTLDEDRGLAPRALERVFDTVNLRRRQGAKIQISLSCLEIYNDTLLDLLVPSDQFRSDLIIVDQDDGSISVRNLIQATADSAADAFQHLYQAERNRAVSSHALNLESSRSHLVVTIYVTSIQDSTQVHQSSNTRAKLHIIDLAGSERVKSSQSLGRSFQEAAYINKSLTFLEQVVIALGGRHVHKNQHNRPFSFVEQHIPFRSSKLTHLLKDSLGRSDATATLLACVWPATVHLEQTRATLRFSARMRRVSPRRSNHSSNLGSDSQNAERHVLVNTLRAEIRALKHELAVRDLIAHKQPISYTALSSREIDQAASAAHAFVVESDAPLPPVVSVAQVHAVYRALRNLAREGDLIQKTQDISAQTLTHNASISSPSPQSSPKKILPPINRPQSTSVKLDETAFARWRASESQANAELEQELAAAKSEFREASNNAKLLAKDVNDAKRAIDTLREQDSDDGVEEMLASVKAEYRAAFSELKTMRAEAQRWDHRRKDLFRNLVGRFQQGAKSPLHS